MPGPEAMLGIDPVVEGIILGYKNNNYIGLELFPYFPFDYDGGTVPIFGKEYNRRGQTAYAIGAQVNMFDFTVSHCHITMHRHNAAVPLADERIQQWLIKGMAPEVIAAKLSMDKILMEHEFDCAGIAMAAGSYAAGLSQNAAAAWLAPAFGLIAQIFTQKAAVATLIGRKPNVFWCGQDVWDWGIILNTGVQTAAALARGFVTGATMPPDMITPEVFATIIGVDKVIIGKAMVASDIAPITNAYVWADTAGLCYNPGADMFLEPHFGYTFRGQGFPQVKEAWRMEDRHSWVYEVNDHLGPQIVPPTHGAVATESGYLWTNCI